MFFAGLEHFRLLPGDEFIFTCYEDDKQFEIFMIVDGKGPYNVFSIQSEILIRCLDHAMSEGELDTMLVHLTDMKKA